MKNKRGFTLIELLAIIVILAIIAVITVPIILDIIDNSKKGAAQDSAYGYKDAINKYYLGKLSENSEYDMPDGIYRVDGTTGYLVGTETLEIQVSGKKPNGGAVQLENNEISKACLQFDEYAVSIINGIIGTTIVSTCDGVDIVYNSSSNNNDNNNTVDNGNNNTVEIVYYDPINGITNCTNYVPNNSIPTYKGVVPETNDLGQTSCLKWYKYSTNEDGTVNMILDHNTEVNKQYYTSWDNSNGPSNLMQYLTLSEWKEVPTRNDKYIAYLDDNGTKTPIFTNLTDNAVDYTGKKARLITAQEVAEITGAASSTSPGISWNEQNSYPISEYFYFDSKNKQTFATKESPSSYYWLFEQLNSCEQFGCVNEAKITTTAIQLGNTGYWTSSPNAGSSANAWYVTNNGALNSYFEVNSYSHGVRPVITISLPAATTTTTTTTTTTKP